MEENNVFEEIHRLIHQLLTEKTVTGLRVDHVDGLYDPEEYLKRLRTLAPDAYIVVEKILLNGENLPETWPIQGTTGYDFLNQLNSLFVATENEEELSRVYRKFVGNKKTFVELVYQNKKCVARTYFGGDVENLARLLLRDYRRQAVWREVFNAGSQRSHCRVAFNFPNLPNIFQREKKRRKRL